LTSSSAMADKPRNACFSLIHKMVHIAFVSYSLPGDKRQDVGTFRDLPETDTLRPSVMGGDRTGTVSDSVPARNNAASVRSRNILCSGTGPS